MSPMRIIIGGDYHENATRAPVWFRSRAIMETYPQAARQSTKNLIWLWEEPQKLLAKAKSPEPKALKETGRTRVRPVIEWLEPELQAETDQARLENRERRPARRWIR